MCTKSMSGIDKKAEIYSSFIFDYLMANKKIVFRDWIFLRINFWCSSYYLAHLGDYNSI